MSTRSTIAIENANGTIKKVYCHFDGYISHNGKILAEQYSNPADWRGLCYGKDIRGFDMNDGIATPQRYEREEDEPMFPDEYPDYASYVASIDHLFHEFNYLMRKDGEMEVIVGDWRRHGGSPKAKPKSLKRCLGRLKAKKFIETKNSMSE